jgi:AAA15 family ATPase/GTPase
LAAFLQLIVRTKPVHVEFFSRVGCLKKIIIIAGPNGAGKTRLPVIFYLLKPTRLDSLMQI